MIEVINNTSQLLTLVNGTKLGGYKSVKVKETEQLKSQLDNLVRMGLVRVI